MRHNDSYEENFTMIVKSYTNELVFHTIPPNIQPPGELYTCVTAQAF
jgi:hypothetical protein